MKINKHQTPAIRKQQILLAAEIVLLKDGLQNFTIDQVIAHAQIAKGTVYKYYKTKDQLLAELSIKSVSMMFEVFKKSVLDQESSISKIRAVCMACYQFYRNSPQYYSLLNYFEQHGNEEERAEYLKVSMALQQFIQQIIDEGKKSGEINPNLETQFIDYIIWACCVGVIQFIDSKKSIIPNFKQINQEKLIETFSYIITSGLSN
jgi:AcrR family transcriptional regulator